MGINKEAIKGRVLDGLKGKSLVDGTRIPFGKFAQDFTDKSAKGLDAFAQEVQAHQQDRDTNDKDDMEIE